MVDGKAASETPGLGLQEDPGPAPAGWGSRPQHGRAQSRGLLRGAEGVGTEGLTAVLAQN